MKLRHGRAGESNEYFEVGVGAPRAGVRHPYNVVAQKGAGGVWYLYVVEKGMDGAVRTVGAIPEEVDVKRAVILAAGAVEVTLALERG